ncbi:MAG: penicillin-binding protein 2 [Actinomycetota bacterium]|nr:penicillin-binding protein 2 [Actinomycetota bacterium]
MNSDNPRLRLSILGVVVFSLFAALFARLWYLQVMSTGEFQVAAEANRIRTVAVEAPRGRILDRNGKLIVGNRVSVQVTIDRSVLDELDDEERQAVLARVADALSQNGVPKTVAQLEERIADQRYSPYVPVPVAGDVPEDLKIWIDEHHDELPAIAAERVAVRSYPYQRLAAHVLGYTGKVTKEELDAVPDDLAEAKPYTLNDEIGKSGLERMYEADLRGVPGIRRIEVDADGDPVRTIDDQPPVPGNDLFLNLDIDIQAVAEQALKSGLDKAARRGSFGYDAPNVGAVGSTVVLDPNNGGVIAMASFPNYAPADFSDGISQTEWSFLTDKANHFPLNNWALQGQYAPGSTFKPFTANAALTVGLVTPQTTIEDRGVYEIPNCKDERCERTNDGSKAYGRVDLRRSLTVSSDVYYYGLGAQFWIQRDNLGGPERMADLLKEWGFYEDTGIDLPNEKAGRIPSPAWKKRFCEDTPCIDDRWFTGDNVNMAIGQGDVLVTPLQLASAYSTLGNGGTRWVPQLVREIRQAQTEEIVRQISPEAIGAVDMQPDWRAAMVEGLIGVTTQEGGTAVGAFAGFPSGTFPVAAKTGTAQVNNKAPTAVFGAFAPAGAPQFAISVLMEEAGYGGSAAAPVARRLLDVLSGTVPKPDALDSNAVAVDPGLIQDVGDVRD